MRLDTYITNFVEWYIWLRGYRSTHMSDIQQAVKEKYGAIAASVTNASKNTGCCGTVGLPKT